MARPFAALERFVERLFERPSARLFGAPLQPVQLEGRVERAMEAQRHVGGARTYVPDRYRVQLHPDDLARFAGFQATLEQELAEVVLARARQRGYTLVERPRVTLHGNRAVARGDMEVLAELRDPMVLKPAPPGFVRAADDDVGSASRAAAEVTAVFVVPDPHVPEAALLIEVPGAVPVRLPVAATSLTIGRGRDNDIVLPDERVSRRHGRLSARQGTLVYTDLGSTNGSYVNGVRVDEIAVGPGDELRLGASRVTIEAG